MNHTEQPNKKSNHPDTVQNGLSHDDLTMLNQVLQQVKGISCVSYPTREYQMTEQAAEQA